MVKNYDLEVLNYELRASVSPRNPFPISQSSETRNENARPRQAVSEFDVLNYELLAMARARSPKISTGAIEGLEKESKIDLPPTCEETNLCSAVTCGSAATCGSAIRARCTKLSFSDITNQKPTTIEEVELNSGHNCGE
jgi:hypothetical protein